MWSLADTQVYRKTIETGRAQRFDGAGLDPRQVGLLVDLLEDALLAGGRTDILAGYWMDVREEADGLHAKLGHVLASDRVLASLSLTPPPDPVMTVSIKELLGVVQSASGASAKQLLRVAGGMGDLERCLGWAWLTRRDRAGSLPA